MKKKPKKTTNLLEFAQGKTMTREPRFYLVMEEDGIETCSQPGWPEEVQDHDTVLVLHFYTTKEIEEYHNRIGFKP